jgi:hypothetical protein
MNGMDNHGIHDVVDVNAVDVDNVADNILFPDFLRMDNQGIHDVVYVNAVDVGIIADNILFPALLRRSPSSDSRDIAQDIAEESKKSESIYLSYDN